MTKKTRRRRRWEGRLPTSFDRRVVLWIVGIGVGSFLLGYLLIAILFYRGGNRPAVVSVPELREMTVTQARDRLREVGLEMEIGDSLPNPEVPHGSVLAQSPLPGREVAPGSGVRLIVSSGQVRRAVADVSAMGGEQASRVLQGLGFQVEVTETTGPQAAGRALGTDPPAGTVLPLAARVLLTVSTGPPLAEVPDLVGLTEQEARSTLETIGFAVGEIEYELRGTEPGMVLSQWPLPGDSLRLGAGVRLSVATDRPDAGFDP